MGQSPLQSLPSPPARQHALRSMRRGSCSAIRSWIRRHHRARRRNCLDDDCGLGTRRASWWRARRRSSWMASRRLAPWRRLASSRTGLGSTLLYRRPSLLRWRLLRSPACSHSLGSALAHREPLLLMKQSIVSNKARSFARPGFLLQGFPFQTNKNLRKTHHQIRTDETFLSTIA